MPTEVMLEMAIAKTSGWSRMNCEGWCFPPVYRAWMGHFAFQLA